MRARNLVHVGTRSTLWPSQGQQSANLLKREPEVAGTPDESQRPFFGWPVDPTPDRRAGRCRQHFAPLVISDGLTFHAALVGHLAEAEGFRSVNHERTHDAVLARVAP